MTRHNQSARTLSRTHLALLLFALATTLTIAGQTWWAIVQDKQQTLASETNNGLVAVRLMEEHANQTLQDAVHTLDRVARAVQASDHHESPAVIRGIVASHDIGHSRHLKALQYVSPQGSSWISSPDYPTHQTEASQHSHIQYLLKNPADDEPVVGHPYASPYDSQWVIPVARTLYDQRGLPAGVVSVDIRLSYFGALYSRVAKENKAGVTLLSNQGFILARSPFEARYVGRDVTDSPLLDTLRAGAVEGSFDDEAFLDDDEGRKLYTYRRLAGFPVTMVYARDYANVLASWENRTDERLLLAIFSIALVAALTYTLRVYIQRLQRTQLSLHDSEAKFFGLFRQSPVPHTLVRIQTGQFVETNDAWLNQYGYQLQDVIGRTAHELGLWVNPAQRENLVAALAPNGTVDRFEVEHRHRDGHSIICLMSGRSFVSGEENLTLFTLIDVTQQRKAEQEIRSMNLELELRVQARTEKLEIANQELSVALDSVRAMQTELVRSEKLAALGSLVAGVAHELNTPIGNSVTVGSTLQFQVDDLAQAFEKGELRRSTLQLYLENAQRGTDILMRALARASELIRSFKRVAVDQSSDQRRVFDLQTTLREVCLTLEPMYKNTPFDLTLALPDKVEMDSFPGALGQLVTNFVSNALQHGFEGRERGQMHVRAEASGVDHVTLLFSDDGIGMTEETRNRVFDPFFTTKLGQGGSGLGMNIVYNIVHDVLGGSIHIASSPDAGTLITVRIPVRAPLSATGESHLRQPVA
nr:ATP-binding protein [uncultured Rhodoferax sp.]